MKQSLRLLAAALLLFVSAAHAEASPPWGRGESRGEDLSVWLVTFGPGSDVESWWGHASLVVQDRRLHEGRLYNYGMFSFDDKMLMRFAMGRLEFWVGEAGISQTLNAYREENRSVHIQELNLLPEERMVIAQALAENVLPEHRDYLYDHYKDNCATRPRDMIDRAVGGQLKQATVGAGRYTLRDHTHRYTSVNPPMSLLLDFMMNGGIDRPITQQQEAFLPDELERQVASLHFKNAHGDVVSLAPSSKSYAESTRKPVPPTPPSYAVWLLLLGGGLGGLALALGVQTRRGSRWGRIALGSLQALLGFLYGLPGFLLLVMWVVTNHTVTFHNENLFLSNPLTLLTVPLGISLARGKRATAAARLLSLWRVLLGLVALGVLLKVLPMFHQANGNILCLLLPLELGMGAAAWLAAHPRQLEALGTNVRALTPAVHGTPDRKAGSR